jgi:hypothetical protein
VHLKTRTTASGDWIGGRGGIRTHGTVSRTTVFKTVALNHSATLPLAELMAINCVTIKPIVISPCFTHSRPQGLVRAQWAISIGMVTRFSMDRVTPPKIRSRKRECP